MRSLAVAMLSAALLSVPPAFAAEGLISMKSAFGVKETADRVARLAKDRGMTLFARVDHAQGARTVGMSLPPTELLIFGNPKGGTPLMQCGRTVGIDLPLKMLVWEDSSGTAWIAYNDPEYLKERHGIVGCDKVLQKVGRFLDRLARDSSRPGN